MDVVGYAKFVVHPTENRGLLLEYKANDIMFEDYLGEFAGSNVDDLINLDEVLEKNQDVKGCLVLATFDYRSWESFNGESTEWESDTYVRDVIILDKNYKEQWRRNLTYEYGHSTLEAIKEEGCMQDIWEWEEFYEEDFEFHKEKPDIRDVLF